MQYGDLVDPIFLADTGWRFVVADQHDIARKVKEEWSDSRIVGWPKSGDLAVAVFVPRSTMGSRMSDDSVKANVSGAGGAWVLSMRLKDPTNGKPRRTLEGDVITEMRSRDSHRRRRNVDPRTMYNELLAAHEKRTEAIIRSNRDRNLARIEEQLFAAARAARIPWNPSRIVVP